MPGTPFLPGVVWAENVPVFSAADGPSSGLTAWGFITFQVAVTADDVEPLFGITAPSVVNETYRNGSNDLRAPTELAFDRIGLYLIQPRVAAAPLTTLEIAIFAGFDCDGEQVFRGTTTLKGGGNIEHFAQVSGHLANHWQIRARLVPGGAPKADFALRIITDRAGGPFQIHWGPNVTKVAPVAPYKVLP